MSVCPRLMRLPYLSLGRVASGGSEGSLARSEVDGPQGGGAQAHNGSHGLLSGRTGCGVVEEKGTVRKGEKKGKKFRLKQSRRHGLEKKRSRGAGNAWENMPDLPSQPANQGRSRGPLGGFGGLCSRRSCRGIGLPRLDANCPQLPVPIGSNNVHGREQMGGAPTLLGPVDRGVRASSLTKLYCTIHRDALDTTRCLIHNGRLVDRPLLLFPRVSASMRLEKPTP